MNQIMIAINNYNVIKKYNQRKANKATLLYLLLELLFTEK